MSIRVLLLPPISPCFAFIVRQSRNAAPTACGLTSRKQAHQCTHTHRNTSSTQNIVAYVHMCDMGKKKLLFPPHLLPPCLHYILRIPLGTLRPVRDVFFPISIFFWSTDPSAAPNPNVLESTFRYLHLLFAFRIGGTFFFFNKILFLQAGVNKPSKHENPTAW